MNECVEMFDMMDDYIDDELTSERRQMLAAHLGTCPECTARLRLLLMMKQAAPELAEDAPDGFAAGVMDKVRALSDGDKSTEDEPGGGEAEAQPEPSPQKRRFYPMPFTMVAAAAVLMIFCFQTGFFGLLGAPAQTDIDGNMGVTFAIEGADSVLSDGVLPTLAGGSDNDTGEARKESGQTTVGYTAAATAAINNSTQPNMMSPYVKQLPGLAPLEAYENGLYQFVYYVMVDSVPQDVYERFISTLSELQNTYDDDNHYYIVTREQYDGLYALLTDTSGVTEAMADKYPHLLDETVPYGAVVFY